VTHAWEVDGWPKLGGFSVDDSLVYLLGDRHGVDVWQVADLPRAVTTPEKLKPFAHRRRAAMAFLSDGQMGRDGNRIVWTCHAVSPKEAAERLGRPGDPEVHEHAKSVQRLAHGTRR
jgi:hypothetical protein